MRTIQDQLYIIVVHLRQRSLQQLLEREKERSALKLRVCLCVSPLIYIYIYRQLHTKMELQPQLFSSSITRTNSADRKARIDASFKKVGAWKNPLAPASVSPKSKPRQEETQPANRPRRPRSSESTGLQQSARVPEQQVTNVKDDDNDDSNNNSNNIRCSSHSISTTRLSSISMQLQEEDLELYNLLIKIQKKSKARMLSADSRLVSSSQVNQKTKIIAAKGCEAG